MQYQIFYAIPEDLDPAEVNKIHLYQNRVGYTCFSAEVNKYERNPGTWSGWVGRAYDPRSKEWVEFPYWAHYTHVDLFSPKTLAPERSFTVYLIAENEAEKGLVSNCQACVHWTGWNFQICLIPDADFYPPSKQ